MRVDSPFSSNSNQIIESSQEHEGSLQQSRTLIHSAGFLILMSGNNTPPFRISNKEGMIAAGMNE
jgi:hypothetical protein